MYLTADNIIAAVFAADNISSQKGVYPKDGNWGPYASVDAIIDYVRSKCDVPVLMKDVAFDGIHICARLERWKDRIEICVRADQTDPWKRFGAIKELAHIIIDKEQSFSPYGDERIEELIQSGLIGLASERNGASNPPSQSEYLAEIAAIEIMYPIDRRVHDLKSIPEGETFSIRKAALERQMPEFYVQTSIDRTYLRYLQDASKECKTA